jgi:hypothetical protein
LSSFPTTCYQWKMDNDGWMLFIEWKMDDKKSSIMDEL